jgi:hypothetical protein
MTVVIKVLEEALSVQSVLSDYFLETNNDVLNNRAFFFCWLSACIMCGSTSVVKVNVN